MSVSLEECLRGHLLRLGAAAAGSALAACILLTASLNEKGQGFATMTLGWSLVNLVIVGLSLLPKKKPLERSSLREFLWLNQGLNVGYVGVGTALTFLSSPSAAGMGWAVIPQGLILLILDGVLIHQTRAPAPAAEG